MLDYLPESDRELGMTAEEIHQSSKDKIESLKHVLNVVVGPIFVWMSLYDDCINETLDR